MRVLVTGGAGFLGSSLVDRLLAEGHGVDVVDDLSTGALAHLADARADPSYEVTFHHVDVRDPGLVDLVVRRAPEVVFHLAAQTDPRLSVSHPAFDAEVNVAGSVNVIEAARRAGAAKVVFASSDAIYGEVGARDRPVREGHPRQPTTPFGVGKEVVTSYLSAYRELYELEFTALVFGHVYGPRQEPAGDRGVVSVFADHLLGGRTATIFGDGEQTRDLVYVDDAVDALARAATRGSGLVVNVGTGVATTVNEVYRQVAAEVGSAAPPVHVAPRDGDLRHSVLDPGRAAIHLGWRPWTALADGIAAVADWLEGRSA